MRAKTAAMVLGGATLLVLLVLLKNSIGSSADAPSHPITSDDAERTTTPDAAPTAAAGAARRSSRIASASSSTSKSTSTTSERPRWSEAIAAAKPPSEPVPAKGKSLAIADKPTLREQVYLVKPLVEECVAKATGKKDGTVMFYFVVAPTAKQTAIVESTGVDEDATSVDNAALVECIHKTGLAMKFDYNPNTYSVIATRKVTIENGQVTYDDLVNFSYIRDRSGLE